MEENLNYQQLQIEINRNVNEALESITQEFLDIRAMMKEMNSIISELNQRSLNTMPHLFSPYMTLLETEFAEKLKKHFDSINKIVAEKKGGLILDSLFDKAPDEDASL